MRKRKEEFLEMIKEAIPLFCDLCIAFIIYAALHWIYFSIIGYGADENINFVLANALKTSAFIGFGSLVMLPICLLIHKFINKSKHVFKDVQKELGEIIITVGIGVMLLGLIIWFCIFMADKCGCQDNNVFCPDNRSKTIEEDVWKDIISDFR